MTNKRVDGWISAHDAALAALFPCGCAPGSCRLDLWAQCPARNRRPPLSAYDGVSEATTTERDGHGTKSAIAGGVAGNEERDIGAHRFASRPAEGFEGAGSRRAGAAGVTGSVNDDRGIPRRGTCDHRGLSGDNSVAQNRRIAASAIACSASRVLRISGASLGAGLHPQDIPSNLRAHVLASDRATGGPLDQQTPLGWDAAVTATPLADKDGRHLKGLRQTSLTARLFAVFGELHARKY